MADMHSGFGDGDEERVGVGGVSGEGEGDSDQDSAAETDSSESGEGEGNSYQNLDFHQDSAPEVAVSNTFSSFSRLPTELRLEIWSLIGHCPRRWIPVAPIVALLKKKKDIRAAPIMTVLRTEPPPDFVDAIRPRSALLQASSEARQEARRTNAHWSSVLIEYYETVDSQGRRKVAWHDKRPSLDASPKIAVNPIDDVFFFNSSLIRSRPFCKSFGLDNPAAHAPMIDAAPFDVVQHIAISFDTLYAASPREEEIFVEFLGRFKKLEDLTIVLSLDNKYVCQQPMPRSDTLKKYVADHFEEVHTPLSLDAEPLVRRHVERLFSSLGSGAKMPAIKVIFHSWYRFSLEPGYWDYSPRPEPAGFTSSGKWFDKKNENLDLKNTRKKNWDARLHACYGDILEELEALEARRSATPSLGGEAMSVERQPRKTRGDAKKSSRGFQTLNYLIWDIVKADSLRLFNYQISWL